MAPPSHSGPLLLGLCPSYLATLLLLLLLPLPPRPHSSAAPQLEGSEHSGRGCRGLVLRPQQG